MWQSLRACCCPNVEEKEDENSERSRLIPNGSSSRLNAANAYGALPPGSDRTSETDEQAILNQILNRTACNIIDVSAMDIHSVEAHEFADRARKYGQYLVQNPYGGPKKPTKKLLADVSHVEKLLAAPPQIHQNELNEIQNLAAEISKTATEIRVCHKEELVVQFDSIAGNSIHSLTSTKSGIV